MLVMPPFGSNSLTHVLERDEKSLITSLVHDNISDCLQLCNITSVQRCICMQSFIKLPTLDGTNMLDCMCMKLGDIPMGSLSV